jgi:hypothetical protein
MSRGVLCMLVMGLGVPAGAWAAPLSTLGVTVSPVGAYTTWAPNARASGYSAGVSWRFQRPGALFAVGGHASSARTFSEATPVAVRFTPLAGGTLQPFLGAGASFLVVHGAGTGAGSVLRLGAELSGGVDVSLGGPLFLAAEARLQDFSLCATPLGTGRMVLGAAHLGMGMRL